MSIRELDEYQAATGETAIFPGKGEFLGKMYCALKLAGEAGEVSEKIGKIIRDQNCEITQDNVENLKKELGDVMWYVAQLSSELGLSLSEVAQANVDKLRARKARGTISGSGDDR